MNQDSPPANHPSGSESPRERRIDASELLSAASDSDFLESAYLRLFRRQPDERGLLEYRFLLRCGISRAEILLALACSEEAARLRVRLDPLPATPRRSLLSRALLSARIRLRRLRWDLLERAAEEAEQRLFQRAQRLWRLYYRTSVSLARRQSETEAAIHALRRETEERFATLLEAIPRAAPDPAPDAGFRLLRHDGLRIALGPQDWRRLEQDAIARHLPPGAAQLLPRILEPGMTVADTRAGVGVFALHAARIVLPRGRIYAFEPDQALFALLEGNLAGNLACLPGTAVAKPVSPAPDFPGGAPLDDLLFAEPRVDLVRLSGQEAVAVLRGLSAIQAANPSLRLLWDGFAGLPQSAAAEALDRLRCWGFSCAGVHPETGELTPAPGAAAPPAGLLLFSRNGLTGAEFLR